MSLGLAGLEWTSVSLAWSLAGFWWIEHKQASLLNCIRKWKQTKVNQTYPHQAKARMQYDMRWPNQPSTLSKEWPLGTWRWGRLYILIPSLGSGRRDHACSFCWYSALPLASSFFRNRSTFLSNHLRSRKSPCILSSFLFLETGIESKLLIINLGIVRTHVTCPSCIFFQRLIEVLNAGQQCIVRRNMPSHKQKPLISMMPCHQLRSVDPNVPKTCHLQSSEGIVAEVAWFSWIMRRERCEIGSVGARGFVEFSGQLRSLRSKSLKTVVIF